MEKNENINNVKEPSWDTIIADVRNTLFTQGAVPSRDRVSAYIFGKYGLECNNGFYSSGSADFTADVVITPRGTPRTLRIEWKKGSEAVISFFDGYSD